MYAGRTAPEVLRIIQILHSGKALFSCNLHVCKELIRVPAKFHSTEMANHWRIAVMTCLVLFMMMEDAKPDAVPFGNLGNRVAMLEEKLKALEETCMDKCKRKYT